MFILFSDWRSSCHLVKNLKSLPRRRWLKRAKRPKKRKILHPRSRPSYLVVWAWNTNWQMTRGTGTCLSRSWQTLSCLFGFLPACWVSAFLFASHLLLVDYLFWNLWVEIQLRGKFFCMIRRDIFITAGWNKKSQWYVCLLFEYRVVIFGPKWPIWPTLGPNLKTLFECQERFHSNFNWTENKRKITIHFIKNIVESYILFNMV